MAHTLDKDAIKRANPIEGTIPALLNELPIEVGGELKVRCPWHQDKRPSLRINPSKGVWRCDPCNIGGDVFEFVQRFEHLTFPEALTRLAVRAGVSNHNGHGASVPTGTSRAGSHLRPARWPQPHVLRYFDYAVASDLLARKVRYDETTSDRKMRWIHSRDGGQTWFHGQGCDDPGLFGIEEALALARRKNTDAVLIAEGERDARRLLNLGWPAVSPPHGAALTMGDKWRAPYSNRLKGAGFARAYLVGDHDKVGEGEPGHGNGFNGDIARALNTSGIDARPVPWDATDPAGFDVTEFFDFHGDAEAKALLRARIEAVKAGEPWRDPKPIESPREQSPGSDGGSHPVLTCLADVAPEQVMWTWPARVASGKLNLLVGDPGLGKSFITLDMVARYTTGRAWPDGSSGGPIGSAILLSAEDGLADTIRPRLDALGADSAFVHHVATVREGRKERGDPARGC